MKNLFLHLLIVVFLFSSFSNEKDQDYIFQSKRKIPVAAKVDVVIIGGTTAAVSAAESAVQNGASVFLVAPKPYLGEDLCATLRLSVDENRKLNADVEKQLFGESKTATPMDVKGLLTEKLQKSNVQFIYGAYVSDILIDAGDKIAGVVVVNRAGRQAIVAKTIIDATTNAWVCKKAGAETEKWNGEKIDFERIIVMPGVKENEPDYVVKKLSLPMENLDFLSFAEAEQLAREKTYTNGQLRASENLFYIPPAPVICQKRAGDWKTGQGLETGFFRPKGFENIFVLNGCADLPQNEMNKLLQSAALCPAGDMIGKKAAEISKQTEFSREIKVKTKPAEKSGNTDVKELLQGLRPVNKNEEYIENPAAQLPVVAEYDVVVIGGGTSGAPAAIGAARNGTKVLVVEYLEGLGGISTLGMIGKSYHGIKKGFSAEVPFPKGNIEPKMEWFRSEIAKAGGDIWFGAIGCGAIIENNSVKGALIATPQGRVAVSAKVVIDATGNSDIAIAAGVDYMHATLEKGNIASQGTGLSSRPVTGNYYNSDYLIVDETDMIDVWRSFASAHIIKSNENQYDAVPIIMSRERRRIVGDYVLTYLDQISGRTFSDAILYSKSDYDSHGYPSSPYFALLPHDSISAKKNHPAPGGNCYTPYRCLLPKGLEGLLVVGIGISMDRDATAMVRMQFDQSNLGYAAGMAATQAIVKDQKLREIDVDELQEKLVEKEILPEEVLKHIDSYPFPTETVKQAVIDYGRATNPQSAGKPLAIILLHKKTALPIVKEEFKDASDKSRLLYAQVLGVWGDNTGVPLLIEELKKIETWDEKILQGRMADYAHLPTRQDGIILALGYSGDKTALPHLINLVNKLNADVTLSHHRSLAIALEKYADPSAAQPLAELINKPGMSGHFLHQPEKGMPGLENNGIGKLNRTNALREIILARALYHCGDYENTGKEILQKYAADIRGLFAKHANMILTEEKE